MSASLTDAEHEALAKRLFRAARTGQGIEPPSKTSTTASRTLGASAASSWTG